jgi:SAM-dependent methyltransferase
MTLLDSTTRFSATADDYDRYRPDYPPAILDWIVEAAQLLPAARIVDLGCGTGIAARQLAERGYRVIGIDPNARMLGYARGYDAGAHGPFYVRARAEALPLAADAAALVTMAQSAHWFVVDEARRAAVFAELARVAPFAVALWNRRAKSPFMSDYDALIRAYAADYSRVPTVEQALQQLRTALPAARTTKLPHRQMLDRAGLVGRAWSSSYVAHGVKERAAFDGALDRLFTQYAEDDRVEFLFETVAVAWATRD